jgi:hypothetical protein
MRVNQMGFKILFSLVIALAGSVTALAQDAKAERKIVIIAGKPSHPPRMHEFNAGV